MRPVLSTGSACGYAIAFASFAGSLHVLARGVPLCVPPVVAQPRWRPPAVRVQALHAVRAAFAGGATMRDMCPAMGKRVPEMVVWGRPAVVQLFSVWRGVRECVVRVPCLCRDCAVHVSCVFVCVSRMLRGCVVCVFRECVVYVECACLCTR